MGPILIFDKSALQSLSEDESVWLDNYFLTNITPLFYVETLADLSLIGAPRPPERIISEIATKTPRALPNVHHGRLVLGNLFGLPVETDHGRPIVERGVTKRSPDGKIGVHFDESPEEKAMNRWHQREYYEIEREFARQWRSTLDLLNFDSTIGIVKNILPSNQRLTTLEQIKSFLDDFIHGNSKELVLLAIDLLGITSNDSQIIINRWENNHRPPFDEFAPYAAYVFKIDLLFYIAAFRGLIAKERPTNKVDLAYLYYLPFCHVFISGDKLHARTVPLFMRKDQTFMSSREFKEGLATINDYYDQFQNEISEVGVMKFAPYPPTEISTSIHKLWDLHCPSWRKSAVNYKKKDSNIPKSDSSLLNHLNKVNEESETIDPNILESMDEADHVMIKHMVAVQKGKWRILPKGIENKEKSD